jgi:hypothetical protein
MNLSILNPSMQSSSSNSAINNQQLMNVSSILNSSTNSNFNNGRFTPACFPGRTTPIASLSASLFEQGNRASIVSPLTVMKKSFIFNTKNFSFNLSLFIFLINRSMVPIAMV